MTHKKILLDLQYLPPIQWFSKAEAHDIISLEAQEHYTKGSYRNRCHIGSAQGLLRLTVPLASGKNSQMPIREVKISNDTPWQNQHWTSIKSAYGKSPFFEFYADDLEPFYQKEYEKLWDWNYDLLNCITEALGLDFEYVPTENYEKEPAPDTLDFRGGIHPNPRKQKVDADYKPKEYEQVFAEKFGFISNLSILDALFCKGPETLLLI